MFVEVRKTTKSELLLVSADVTHTLQNTHIIENVRVEEGIKRREGEAQLASAHNAQTIELFAVANAHVAPPCLHPAIGIYRDQCHVGAPRVTLMIFPLLGVDWHVWQPKTLPTLVLSSERG